MVSSDVGVVHTAHGNGMGERNEGDVVLCDVAWMENGEEGRARVEFGDGGCGATLYFNC
jgi:hypothetical protein